MTPHDWASKKVAQAITGYQWNGRVRKSPVNLRDFAARLLRQEHQRAVRVVERYLKAYGTEGSPCELICNDLLHKLKEGRT